MNTLESVMKQGLLPSRELMINVLHQSPDPLPVPFTYDKIPIQVTIPDFQIYDQMMTTGGNHG
jgi:hypothetical protein